MVELVIYVIGYLVTWRLMFRALYNQHKREWPSLTWDSNDTFFAVMISTIVCLAWPLVLAFLILSKVLSSILIPSDIRSEISDRNDRKYGRKNPVIENPVKKDGAFNITSLKDWYKK